MPCHEESSNEPWRLAFVERQGRCEMQEAAVDRTPKKHRQAGERSSRNVGRKTAGEAWSWTEPNGGSV